MSIECIDRSHPDLYKSSTQESNSLPLKVIIQLGRTANQTVHFISTIAQSILSKCIYIGSLGRYTLDDVKNYLFKTQTSLKPQVASDIAQTHEDPPNISDVESESGSDIDQTDEEFLEEERKRYGLKRQDSRISVSSSNYEATQEWEKNGRRIYPDLLPLMRKSSYKRTQGSDGKDCSFVLNNITE